jgi:aminopeptidase N
LAYSKFWIVILREQVLGKERFDLALRTYIERWAYKHPQPDDFFRTIENVAGEEELVLERLVSIQLAFRPRY